MTRAGDSRWRLAAEGVVIVASILLAFGIDAWWSSTQDRAREAAYLSLVASDLRSTLANNERFGTIADSVVDPATANLVRAYYMQDLPEADSLLEWMDLAHASMVVQPTLGTIEGLVGSGDLVLIRSDSLKAALRQYLNEMKFFDLAQGNAADYHQVEARELSRLVDRLQVELEVTSDEERLARSAQSSVYPFPGGLIRSLPPVDIVNVVRDPQTHRVLGQMLLWKDQLQAWRNRMRAATELLLAQVEQQLAR